MYFVSDVATSQVEPTIPKQDRRRRKRKRKWKKHRSQFASNFDHTRCNAVLIQWSFRPTEYSFLYHKVSRVSCSPGDRIHSCYAGHKLYRLYRTKLRIHNTILSSPLRSDKTGTELQNTLFQWQQKKKNNNMVKQQITLKNPSNYCIFLINFCYLTKFNINLTYYLLNSNIGLLNFFLFDILHWMYICVRVDTNIQPFVQ